MRLDYGFWNNMYGIDSESMNSGIAEYVMNSLKERNEKQQKKLAEIENLTYERNLILNDIVGIIQEDLAESACNIFRYFNVDDMMYEAWRYFNCKKDGQKLEPAERKTEKDYENSFEFVEHTVKNTLIPEEYREKVKLVEFIACGYDAYGYELTYDLNGFEFIIEIPMFHQANVKNYIYMMSGYTLRQHIGYEYTLEFHELNWKEFRKKLTEWLVEKLNKKGESK